MEKNMIAIVAEELRSRGYEVLEQEIMKNNTMKKALTLSTSNGSVAVPTFYESMIEQFRQDGLTKEQIADRIVEYHNEHSFDFSGFEQTIGNKNYLSEHATLRIVNSSWNSPILEDSPYELVAGTDLAIVPYVELSDHASVRITNTLCERAEINGKDLIATAKSNCINAGYSVRDLNDVMSEMMGITLPHEEIPTTVMLTNEEKVHGATALIDKNALDQARELLRAESIFILPSSVHEVLAVPATDDIREEELSSMIKEINANELSPEDRLSDHPYYYDGQSLKMTKKENRELNKGRSR